MTTTDQRDRLAALRARSGRATATAPSEPTAPPEAQASVPLDTVPAAARPEVVVRPAARDRAKPATAAKVVTGGLAVSLVFTLMAAMGWKRASSATVPALPTTAVVAGPPPEPGVPTPAPAVVPAETVSSPAVVPVDAVASVPPTVGPPTPVPAAPAPAPTQLAIPIPIPVAIPVATPGAPTDGGGQPDAASAPSQ